MAYSNFLEHVLSEEVAAKPSQKVTMRTSMARFPFVKPLETFDFGYQPSIDSEQVQQLASCHYIGDNVLVLRAPRSARPVCLSPWGSRRSRRATGRWTRSSNSTRRRGC